MKLINTLILLALSTVVFAQKQTPTQASAVAAAKQMGIALVNKDYAGFVKSTHPRTIEKKEGGLKQLEDNIKGSVEGMEARGDRILKIWPGEPTAIIDTAGELQCAIPQKMTIQLRNGKVTTTSILIAMSPDKGKTWYFADMAGRSLGAMRQNLPNISSKHILPKKEETVFEENK